MIRGTSFHCWLCHHHNRPPQKRRIEHPIEWKTCDEAFKALTEHLLRGPTGNSKVGKTQRICVECQSAEYAPQPKRRRKSIHQFSLEDYEQVVTSWILHTNAPHIYTFWQFLGKP